MKDMSPGNKETLDKLFGGYKPHHENGEGTLEQIVSIPIWEGDDYTSIMYRFFAELDDMDVFDGIHGVYENYCEMQREKNTPKG